jgi:hypothetical protein
MPPMWKPPQIGQERPTPPSPQGILSQPIRKWRCGVCRAIHQYLPRDKVCRNPKCGSYNTLFEMKNPYAKDG